MTSGRLLVGLAVGVAVSTLLILAVRRARRRIVPRWSGPEACLADVVLAISQLTIVANIVGAFGLFKPWPVAGGLVASSAAMWRWGVAPPSQSTNDPLVAAPTRLADTDGDKPANNQHWPAYVVATGIAVVAGMWLSQLPFVARHGIYDWDSLWYHLPMAANFVRTGHFIPLQLYDADIIVSTYPSGAEVFHALGMIVTGSDLLSPVLNACWAALFLLAMHIFGRQFKSGHLATLLGLVILAFPMVVQLEAVSALSEMMAIACLAAACAFVFTGVTPTATTSDSTSRSFDSTPPEAPQWGPALLAGCAIGLMASTKLVMLAPAAALFVGVLVVYALHGRGTLRATWVPLTVATLATGSFWYVRNAIVFHNPVPAVRFGVGAWSLPVVHQLGQFAAMLPTLIDGIPSGIALTTLAQTFGPMWVLYLVGFPIGAVMLATLRGRPRTTIALSWIALISLLAGLFSPQYARNGRYLNLFANGRYLLPGMVVSSLAMVAVVPRSGKWRPRMLIGAAVICFFTALGYLAEPFRNVWFGAYPIATPWPTILVLLVVALVATKGLLSIRNIRTRAKAFSLGGIVVGIALVALLAASAPPFGRDNRDRFDLGGGTSAVYQWAQSNHDRRIGVEPFAYADFARTGQNDIEWIQRKYALIIAYPFNGSDDSNVVQPIVHFDGAQVVRASTCSQWWADLQRMHATDVVIWNAGRPSSAESWTAGSPTSARIAAQPVGRRPGGRLVLYRVDPRHAPC